MTMPRRFDWEQARVMHVEGGLTQAEIARELGVSEGSVFYALNPDRRAETYEVKNARRRLERATRPPAPEPPIVLACSKCKRERPDEDFAKSRTAARSRRGRSSECHFCAAERRRLSREAKRSAILMQGAPRCATVGCFHSAISTITFGTFRHRVPLPARAMSQLGQGVALCEQHYRVATFGNAPASADRGAPTLERIVSRARVVA